MSSALRQSQKLLITEYGQLFTEYFSMKLNKTSSASTPKTPKRRSGQFLSARYV